NASSLAPLKVRSQMPDPLKPTAADPWEVAATPAPVPYATSKPSSGIPKPLRGRRPAALIMLCRHLSPAYERIGDSVLDERWPRERPRHPGQQVLRGRPLPGESS